TNQFNLQPFTIDLSSEIPRLNSLVNNTRLPSQDFFPQVGVSDGIPLETLEQLKNEWVTSFDWGRRRRRLLRFSHFTAQIEGLTVHFIHEKSADPDAIPIILLHGWPGSFQEFLPIIKPLTEPYANSTTGKNVSYNVVVPSLPGFDFSSLPTDLDWSTSDTARVFNTLMTEVLGYKTYTLHGTPGLVIGYDLYANYNTTLRAAHFVFLPFVPPTMQEMTDAGVKLPSDELVTENLYLTWSTMGNAYFVEQAFRPKTLGLALYDSPVGQLSWQGWLWKNMSDPRAGTPPSQLDDNCILTSISLFYLTNTFYSSLWIYEQDPGALNPVYAKPQTDAPMFFSQFEYNTLFWPEEWVAKVGNLEWYRFHDFGGHWAGWDNPPALIQDIRDMGLSL
ncbi:Alpha/Beta hydrolase protein, partial [Roridomyces roridus]